MATKQKNKLEASDSYKNAVKKREVDVFRQRANEIASEKRKEKNAVSRRREGMLAKRQRKIDQKRAEIAGYRKKINRAQKIIDDKIYAMLGTLSLVAFSLTSLMAIILFITKRGSSSAMVSLILACFFIFVSLCFQGAVF